MIDASRVLFLVSFASAVAIATAISPAQSASPSPSPSAPSDPCGPIISIVSRPTVTTAVCAVRPHHALVESGYANSVATGPGRDNTASYPQALVHVGSGDPRLDYELTPPSIVNVNTAGASTRGATDAGAGLKYEMGYTAKASWGTNVAVTLPTGSSAFTAGAAQYTGNFNWTYTLNSVFGLAGTESLNSFAGYDMRGSVRRFFAFIPSFVATANLPANSQLYVEYSYFTHAGAGLGGKSLWDFGLVHDFSPNVQFDVEYGAQPTIINGQGMHYTGAGLSFMV